MNRLQLDPYLSRWIDHIVEKHDDDLEWAIILAYYPVFLLNKPRKCGQTQTMGLWEDIQITFMGEGQPKYQYLNQYKLGKTNLNEFKWVDSNMSGSNTKE